MSSLSQPRQGKTALLGDAIKFIFVLGGVDLFRVVLIDQLAPVLGLVLDQMSDDLARAVLLVWGAFGATGLKGIAYVS